MPRSKDYTTKTEKAKAEFEEKLETMDTQREKREVLEAAAALIPEETEEPVSVKPNPYGRGRGT